MGRSVHLNISDLKGALLDIPRHYVRDAQWVVRWAGVVLELKSWKIGEIKVGGCVDPYRNRTLSA